MLHTLFDYYSDWKYGVKTTGQIPVSKLDLETNSPHARDYEGAKYWYLHKLIKNFPGDPSEYTFIDLGSGKGRAVLLAAQYGFQKIIGIELSKELVEISQENVTSSSSPIKIIHGDAEKFQPPSDKKILFYLYNPFDSVLLRQVLKNLKDKLSDEQKEDSLIVSLNTIRRFIYQLQGFNIIKTLEHKDHNREIDFYTL